jgi:hypothetical protein
MNNPVSSRPGHELFPYPPGCTGHRILELLQTRLPNVTRRQYLDRFDRRNLVPHKIWHKQTARDNAVKLEQELWFSGRTIVLLGGDVANAFKHPRLLLHPQVIGGATWRQVPHPSGRNLWYNHPTNRFMVATLLEDLYNGT